MKTLLTWAALLLLPASALLSGGCAYNEATGRRQLSIMSIDQQIALGEEASQQILVESGGAYPNNALQDYIAEIGFKLVDHVEPVYAGLPWEFTLVDSEQVNAFALPGGKVFIYRGLLERMTNEAQLAGVLAHEIGHITGEHANERISQSMIAQYGAQVLLGAVGASSDAAWAQEMVPLVVEQGTGLLLLRYGREQEAESDVLGIRYMVRAGYNPKGLRQVMQILADTSAHGAPPEFLSTHPHPTTRIETIDALLANEYAQAAETLGFAEPEFRRRTAVISR